MAKVIVDYEAMPKQASDIRGEGKIFEDCMKEVYNEIKSMRSIWYGKRYNKLINEFNSFIPIITKMQELVVSNIPYVLEGIARNYQIADKGSCSINPKEEPIKRIENISIFNERGMRFITSGVINIQNIIIKEFDKSLCAINNINNIFSKVVWEYEAYELFDIKLKFLTSQITQRVSDLKRSFNNLMIETVQDIQKVENANII